MRHPTYLPDAQLGGSMLLLSIPPIWRINNHYPLVVMSNYSENGHAAAQRHQLKKGTVDAPIRLLLEEMYKPLRCIANLGVDR
ncbi:hypothetical protein H6H02_23215 [Coleofasciculus sp. FACHB-1120]|nr:hypothetical protein [Coleofasciculus sp. FACHB-1120]MBD2744441.1 hypothetical protein [Coleofasciculus sp. FACHB-1120]